MKQEEAPQLHFCKYRQYTPAMKHTGFPHHIPSAQQERFLFPPAFGKQFIPKMQLLAKTSVHFANSFWGISKMIVFVNDNNIEFPTKPSDFIPTPPILLKRTTCELFAKVPSNLLTILYLRSLKNSRQLQMLLIISDHGHHTAGSCLSCWLCLSPASGHIIDCQL